MTFNKFIVALLTCCSILIAHLVSAETTTNKQASAESVKNEILKLSKDKWQWMSERDLGGTMSRQQELDVIKSGGIHYKKADVHDVSVEVIGNTAICLNKITLLAVVGGNEVTNPFVVTEIYVQESGNWKLASLSFTRTFTPEPPKK
jgi:hypothetical protein